MAAAWFHPMGVVKSQPNRKTHVTTVRGRYFAMSGFTATR